MKDGEETTHEETQHRVLNLCPAPPGWMAVGRWKSEEGWNYWQAPVAVWATVRERSRIRTTRRVGEKFQTRCDDWDPWYTRVVGMISSPSESPDLCIPKADADNEQFLGYLEPGGSIADLEERTGLSG